MSVSTILVTLIAAGLLAIIIAFIAAYNLLVKERILTQESASGVSAGLQQRNDLIPNLVEIVKGYAGHENKTLVEVVKWRNQSAGAATVADQNAASQGLKHALFNMLSLTENYPDLKANTEFQELMGQLAKIEDKLNDARRYYNGTIRNYNQSIGVFPKSIVANTFGFKPGAFFSEDVEAKSAPKIKFE